MNLVILVNICALLASVSCSTSPHQYKQNSISLPNLNKKIAEEDPSRVHQRSKRTIFGFQPLFNPITISITWGAPNQGSVANSRKPFNQPNRRTNNFPLFQINKNIFFPNVNTNNNNRGTNQQYPAERRTTVRPSITTEPIMFEYERNTPKIQVAETSMPTPTTRLFTTTQPTIIRDLSTESIPDIPATSSAKPQFEIPTTTSTHTPMVQNAFEGSSMSMIPAGLFTSTEQSLVDDLSTENILKPQDTPTQFEKTTITSNLPMITDDDVVSTRSGKEAQGGFTSTSLPDKNAFSELIYDIDPRHR